MTVAATRARPEKAAATSSLQSPKQNQILAALPAKEYARLLPHLELVQLPLGLLLGKIIGALFTRTETTLAPSPSNVRDPSDAQLDKAMERILDSAERRPGSPLVAGLQPPRSFATLVEDEKRFHAALTQALDDALRLRPGEAEVDESWPYRTPRPTRYGQPLPAIDISCVRWETV